MKELWIQIEESAPERDKLLVLATETADVLLQERIALTNTKQKITVLDEFNEVAIRDLKREGKVIALKVNLKGKDDEDTAAKAAELGVDYIIINCLDWRVIPLENLIARVYGKSKLIAEVENAQDAQLVLEALELGTDGVLLITDSAEEISKTAAVVKRQTPKILIISAKVTSVTQIGTGARVCVDTCDLMELGEGILVGSQSAGLFLVEAEVHENPYVASRPFRVNAGSISMYTLESVQNTKYLSELKAGEEVLIVSKDGKTRKANVGRTKTEFRPLILVEAEVSRKKITAILQNAETIRLITPTGSIPVTELKIGDEVLVHVSAKGGRHFGMSVPEEKVIER